MSSNRNGSLHRGLIQSFRPKRHYPSYAFDLGDKTLCDLVMAAKHVGKMIDRNLPGVGRTGMIFEGFGVNHVHAKLFPMHGTANLGEWKPILSVQRKYFDQYEGYISSHDGEKASDERLPKSRAFEGNSKETTSRSLAEDRSNSLFLPMRGESYDRRDFIQTRERAQS